MTIITISRKVGSLGDRISSIVAERLGLKLVGPEDIHRLGQQVDAQFAESCQAFETELPRGLMERLFFNNPAYTSLFESLNFRLAAEGNVVLRGRGAQVVLRGYQGVLNVRVVAPLDIRIQRVRDQDNISQEEAAEIVHRFDEQRRRLIESVFHVDLMDWSLYDLVINTARITAEDGADLICQAAAAMPPTPDPRALSMEWSCRSFAKLVEAAIKKRIMTGYYRNVDVRCPSDGVVEIHGCVQDRRTRQVVLDIARRYPNVTEVVDKIRTTELYF